MIPDLSFDVVIMGDIIEHLYDPWRAIQEAARVCRGVFLMTIFEEWTLPGYGQFIDVGAVHGDEASQKLGYANREEYQTKTFPKRIGVSDDKVPHLVHINQFTDDDIRKFVEDLIAQGWTMIEYSKAYEATFEKHPWYNWLIALSRGVPV
jgi:SAM-dependent methyltransferase